MTQTPTLPVMQADRNAAEEWRFQLCHSESQFRGDLVFALAEDFARHRLASVEDGQRLREALEELLRLCKADPDDDYLIAAMEKARTALTGSAAE